MDLEHVRYLPCEEGSSECEIICQVSKCKQIGILSSLCKKKN
jgi:hypothetical protein